MQRRVVLLMGLLLLLPTVALAVPTISAGNHVLPNAPGLHQVYVTASGGDAVQGVNLSLATGDGGPNFGGSVLAPIITAIDLIADGTLMFNGNNTGHSGTFIPNDQLGQQNTTTNAGTVSASGNLALVTLDTTGFGPGVYAFLVGGVPGIGFPPSDFAGLPTNTLDGTITIVPEPSSVVMALFAVAGVAVVAIRRRRRAA